jgi:hypothetical protein
MQPKRRKPIKLSRPRRDGWGKPILVDLPVDADARLEEVRQRLALDRTSFVRTVVMERLNREDAA